MSPPSVSSELELAPTVALPLWFVIDFICLLSARQALGRFLLGDGHSIRLLTWPGADSVSSCASFGGGAALLVNASDSESEFYTKETRKRTMRVRNMCAQSVERSNDERTSYIHGRRGGCKAASFPSEPDFF
jgi:hypothetical protein